VIIVLVVIVVILVVIVVILVVVLFLFDDVTIDTWVVVIAIVLDCEGQCRNHGISTSSGKKGVDVGSLGARAEGEISLEDPVQ
jgi:hypothetical protein